MSIEQIKFSKLINEEDIYSTLIKNYRFAMTDFFEFQRVWFNRAYDVWKDYDKYLILIYLVRRNFRSYNEYFHKKSYDEFYSLDQFEIEKFNIIEVSKDLFLKKETARRKILELEKEGIIQKNKKIVKINQSGIQTQKPERTILALARLLSNVSKMLVKDKFLKNEISTRIFENEIKRNFTQYWLYFLDFQVPYCLKFKKIFGDLEEFIIVGNIIYNQNLYLRKYEVSADDKNYFKSKYMDDLLKLTDKNGINAMTISDLTGISRPTVIRKLKKLLKTKLIIKDDKNLYKLIDDYEKVRPLDQARIDSVKKLSILLAKFYNFAEI